LWQGISRNLNGEVTRAVEAIVDPTFFGYHWPSASVGNVCNEEPARVAIHGETIIAASVSTSPPSSTCLSARAL
jgi:hypothetical protein